ncbi:MAG: phosphoribosylanthranilate isomerase [Prevotella sp.]|nr:phosphoribosylanthranilate isomerase [Prevotella sp.]
MTIKVCGLRDGQNIREVEALRPDMMGFICWQGSKRNVSELPSYLPKVCRVGVLVNPTVEEAVSLARWLGLDRIQLHGDESPRLCQEIGEATGLPITKAIQVGSAEDLGKCLPYERTEAVDLLLFDTQSQAKGGSGRRFDWSVLSEYDGQKPFLLAGGIGPGDEQAVLSLRHPRLAGIDLNSRFELAPAIKNTDTLRQFINTIRNGQQD